MLVIGRCKMFISDFMTKDVVTIGVESDISKAKELMNRFRIRHLPVTRAENKLIGIVSDRDIRSALPSEHIHDPKLKKMETENVNGLKVREFMTKNTATIKKKFRDLGYVLIDPVDWHINNSYG